MKKADLEKLLQTEEVVFNINLQQDLKDLLKNNEYYGSDIYSYPSSLSISTYQYLLENNYLSVNELLKQAVAIEEGTRKDELIDIALAHGVELNEAVKEILFNNYHHTDEKSISAQVKLMEFLVEKGASLIDVHYIPVTFSNETYKYMLGHGLKAKYLLKVSIAIEEGTRKDELIDIALAHGVELNEAVKEILSNNYHHTDEKSISAQVKLMEFLVEKGASLIDVHHIPVTFSNETYKYMLGHGLKANSLLSMALNIEEGTKKDELIDIALANKANPNKITNLGEVAYIKSLELLISKGLTMDNALKIIINMYNNPFDDTKKELILSLLDRGADINNILDEISINLDILIANKEFILENLGADFLINVLFSLIDIEDTTNNEFFEMAKLTFVNGGRISSKSIEEMYENQMHEFIWNPSRIIDQKYRNLDAPRGEEGKMPYFMHHIWLTSKNNPQEIRSQDLENAIKTKVMFLESAAKWDHIVWTNDKSLIPESVRALEDKGIEVRSIYDYQDELSLFTLIEGMVAESKWGMASDTLRYVLVENFGGVYADINFIFKRDITDEVHKYNFFTKTYGEYYIDNFYFGSSPHHPVTQKMVQLVERNIVNPPKYLASIDQDSTKFTDVATANPTFIAYYLEANKGSNIDVVYPCTKGEETEGDFRISDNYNVKLLELLRQYAPDEIIMLEFSEFISGHEICGIDYYDIGYDSPDGKTWVN